METEKKEVIFKIKNLKTWFPITKGFMKKVVGNVKAVDDVSIEVYKGETLEIDVDAILAKVKEIYKNEEINDIDGVKIDFADKWVHLRKSNTEPIIRVYSEASTMEAAEEIGQKIMDVINELAK